MAVQAVVGVDHAGRGVRPRSGSRRGSARSSGCRGGLPAHHPRTPAGPFAARGGRRSPESPCAQRGSTIGLGSPWPWRDVSRTPSEAARTTRDDDRVVARLHHEPDHAALAPAPHRRGRSPARTGAAPRGGGTSPTAARVRPPSTSRVASRPIALEPLPYRTFSMWVSSSGWKEDVIATPREASTPAVDPRHQRPEQRLGVGAGEVAQPLRDAGAVRDAGARSCSSDCVPHVPAASTTCCAVTVRSSARRPRAPGAAGRDRETG